MLAGVTSRAARHLGRQQARYQAVLVGCPHSAIATAERGSRAFLAAEAERTAKQPLDKPLESDRDLEEFASKTCRDAIDHRAADDGLADSRASLPLAAIPE